MLESIPGASGLQIECGLFLWSPSDVRNSFLVLDSSCAKCAKVTPNHGEKHRWRAMEFMGKVIGMGKKDFGGSLTIPWGTTKHSGSAWGCLVKEIDLGAP